MTLPARYTEQAELFRALHRRAPLLLPNVWDASSAALAQAAGASALATTSAGIAWAHGLCDGQRLTREQMVRSVQGVVRATDLPVTADIEGGYGTGSPADVAETVRAVILAGAVGINLEDAPGQGGQSLLSAEVQAERLRAARAAAQSLGAGLFINARTDVFLAQVGPAQSRLQEAVRRADLYLAAGADGVFVPGVSDEAMIASLAQSISGPLNVMAGPGSPDVQALGRLGVARVSLGPALALAALGAVRAALAEVLGHAPTLHWPRAAPSPRPRRCLPQAEMLAGESLPSRSDMERAYLTRDAAYDGLFFTAVRTTRIFCRPTCPARKPLPRNVTFFQTGLEAQLAGYRPCKRCRPLDEQDRPAWVAGLLADVERAPAGPFSGAQLRARGTDPTTVRRHFVRVYGLTFHAYLRAARLAQAHRQLCAGTPLDTVILESGFGSYSGFRSAFLKAYGVAPGAVLARACGRPKIR
jgi:2-methylisocitrate lyase-like PEP mutase family enzyme/methylphosphotriester-DNA--protein-cysteine methyltransferase